MERAPMWIRLVALVVLAGCGSPVPPESRPPITDGAASHRPGIESMGESFALHTPDPRVHARVLWAGGVELRVDPGAGPFHEPGGEVALELRSWGRGQAQTRTLPGKGTLGTRCVAPWAGTNDRSNEERPLDAEAGSAPCVERVEGSIEALPGQAWWHPAGRGIEHGFDLQTSPPGEGPLSFQLAVRGASVEVQDDGSGATLQAGPVRFRYDRLLAVDAHGRTLPSHMEAVDGAMDPGIRLVIDDSAATYPIVVDPMLSTYPWSLYGPGGGGSLFGEAMAGSGDVNGDGFDDLLVGAPGFTNGQTSEGGAFIYYGALGGPGTQAVWHLEGDLASAACGGSVAYLGDTNNDSRDDFAVGCAGYTSTLTGQGRVVSYLGSAFGPGTVPAETWLGSQAGEGLSEVAALDANGDGFRDLAMGSPGFDNGQTDEGRVQVVFGSVAGLPNAPTWSVEGNLASAQLGATLAAVGGVDGGAVDHLLVLAPGYSNGQTSEGQARLYFGATAGLATTASWTFETDAASASLSAAGALGDLNGDGTVDFGIGAPDYTATLASRGRFWAFFGVPGGPSVSPSWTLSGAAAYDDLGSSFVAHDWNSDGYDDLTLGTKEWGVDTDGRVEVYFGGQAGPETAPAWAFSGDTITSERLGSHLALVGNTDGEGGPDLLISGPSYFNGRIYLFSQIDSAPVPTPDDTMEINLNGNYVGTSVGGAGDVNGDGYGDALLAQPSYSGGHSSEGRAWVHYGTSDGLLTTAQWMVEGNTFNAQFGSSVSGGGDVNGDGFADLAVGGYGAYNASNVPTGRAQVFLGSALGLATTPQFAQFGSGSGDYFGHAVDWAGDVNGDGYSDLLVGAPYYSNGQNYQGQATLYLGSASGLTVSAWAVNGGGISRNFGWAVAGAGDVNGDGYSDAAVGAPLWDNGTYDEGRALVYLGSSGGLATTASWVVGGSHNGMQYGRVVEGPGDVNGDGYSDLLVASKYADGAFADTGRADLYFGSGSGLATTAAWSDQGSTASEYRGDRVAGIGDRNGDGYADFAVSSPGFAYGTVDVGAVSIYHGGPAGPPTTPSLALAPMTATGSSAFGAGLGGGGDVNGDGYGDLIVGYPTWSNGEGAEGGGLLYFGGPSAPEGAPDLSIEGAGSSYDLGAHVASGGDLDGDGYDDLLSTAPGHDDGQTDEGIVELRLGGPTGPSLTADWSFATDQVGAGVGLRAAAAGDVDGDGFGDLLIGARRYSNGQGEEGKVWFFQGSASGPWTANWSMESDQGGAHLGEALLGVGDADGDSDSDFVIAAPDWFGTAAAQGRVWRFDGSGEGPAAASWTWIDSTAGARFGASLAVGDLNEDGYADLLAGAPGTSLGQPGEGAVHAFLGGAATFSTTAPSWTFEGNVAGASVGATVASGDLDGDGDADVIVGSPDEGGGGKLRLFLGTTGGPMATAAWTWTGPEGGAGDTVLASSDMDGDGRSDIILGMPFDGPGRVRIWNGTPTVPLAWPTTVVAGVSTIGPSGEELGRSIAAVGDYDGDGRPDLVAGAGEGSTAAASEGRLRGWMTGGPLADLALDLRRADQPTVRLEPGHWTHVMGAVRVVGHGRAVDGPHPIRLGIEAEPVGAAFDGFDLQYGAWATATSTPVGLSVDASALSQSFPLHARARVEYGLAKAPIVGWGPWTYLGPANEPQGAHVRAIDANSPPVALDDSASVLEDGEIEVFTLDNDSDPDQALTYTSVTLEDPPAFGTATVFSTWVLYEHDGTDAVSDSFTYEICDQGSPVLCDQGTVTISIVDVPDPPTAVADTFTVAEGSSQELAVLTNDVDLDSVLSAANITIESAPAHGSVSLGSVGITYIHDGLESSTDSFSYSVSDGSFDSNIVSITLQITNINDAPSAADDLGSVAEGGSATFAVRTNDTDAEDGSPAGSLSVTTPPLRGTATPSGQSVLYVHDGSPELTDVLTYTVCDSGTPAMCDSATLSLGITPTDDAPVADDDAGMVAEGAFTDLAVLVGDTDEDSTIDISQVSVTAPPAHGTVSTVGSMLRYQHGGSELATDVFTYTLCTAPSGCDSAEVTLIVTPTNDAPSAAADLGTVAEAGQVVVQVLSNDGDPDSTLAVAGLNVTALPSWGTAQVEAGGIRYTHGGSDSPASDVLTYTICDLGTPSLCASNTLTLAVSPTDDPPVATDDLGTVDEGGVHDLPVLDNDTDPDSTLAYSNLSVVIPPAHGIASVVSGAVRYEHGGGESGSDTLRYRICTAAGPCAEASVTLWITPVNDPPVVDLEGTGPIPEGAEPTLTATASDAEPGLLTWAWDCDGDGVFEVSSGPTQSCSFPDDGSTTVSVRVTDSSGAWGEDQMAVAVENVAPVFEFAPIVETIYFTQSWTLDFELVDPGDDTLTVSPTTLPAGMVLLGQQLSWTPVEADIDTSPHSVLLSVDDEDGGASTLQFDLTVYPEDGDGDLDPDYLDCSPLDPSVGHGLPEVACNSIDDDCEIGTPDSFDADGDGADACTEDCDDADALRSPFFTELPCDGVDGDCDPLTLDDADLDGDGFTFCAECDDAAPTVFPGAPEACDGFDSDCDPATGELGDEDGDLWSACDGDCDDADAARYPGLPELCNGVDDDCDTVTDEAADLDNDGATACDGDCDDGNPGLVPGGVEVCGGLDEDCDGTLSAAELDGDGDGISQCLGDCDDADPLRSPFLTELLCDGLDGDCDAGTPDAVDLDGDGFLNCVECDDLLSSVHPGAPEICDGLDTDCDPATGELGDEDGDGVSTCEGDCDDGDPNRTPGSAELCNGLDDDCDLLTNELDDPDADGQSACEGDCAEGDPARHPGAAEGCDDVDADCDGALGPEEADVDGDGFALCEGDCDDAETSRHPGAVEICDGLDQDCDTAPGPPAEDDPDGDGLSACEGDCGPFDPLVRPTLVEACDGLDTDCDGDVAAAEADGDGDGYTGCLGDCDDDDSDQWPSAPEPVTSTEDLNCDGLLGDTDLDGDGWSVGEGDCYDILASVHPEAEEVCDGFDTDCEGGPLPDESVDTDLDGAADCFDCADTDPSIHPGAVERCNGLDDDCDFQPAPDGELDLDGDALIACAGDCDDHQPLARLGFPEDCEDGIDNDCDGTIDVNTDHDHDGSTSCGGDCRDTSSDVYPGAEERCDGLDNDCDFAIDEDWDSDGDGQSVCSGDCDDAAPTVYRLAPPVCDDGFDNDCLPSTIEWEDLDGDGAAGCDVPGDCWEGNVLVGPGVIEDCNNRDDDCDGTVDEGWDGDGDGYLPCAFDCDDTDAALAPGEEEVCDDGLDQDCDGEADEGCEEGDDDDSATPSPPEDLEPPAGCQCESAGAAPWQSVAIGALALFTLVRRRTRTGAVASV